MMKIMAASAVVPGATHARAMATLAGGLADPVLGPISIDEAQLCPQHAGRLSEEVVDRLMEDHPDTAFRLHAVPRVAGAHQHRILDAVNAFEAPEQMAATAALSKRIGAKGYTIHAGQTEHGTLAQAFDGIRRLQDLFGCPVGVEGLYPSPGRIPRWLLGTWREHEEMMETPDIQWACDLSHMNVIAKRERTMRADLVRDIVSSPRCMEIHLSNNDGRADSHQPLDPASPPWWMVHIPHFNPEAVVFYEGVCVDPRRKKAA